MKKLLTLKTKKYYELDEINNNNNEKIDDNEAINPRFT